MGSPRRTSRDKERKVDIKDRLQALAKPFTGDAKKSSARDGSAVKSKNTNQSGKESRKNEKISSRKESIERVMERARTEGGTRWTKKLLDEEAKDPDRWGHSGFKEMYKNELGMGKSRRSRSRDKISVHHSRSRERAHKVESNRAAYNRDKSSGGQRSNNISRKRRSRSSSDRSVSDVKWRAEPGRISGNGASHDKKPSPDKGSKGVVSRISRHDSIRKLEERRRELSSKKTRVLKKRTSLQSHSRSRSPVRHSDKTNSQSKKPMNSTKLKTTRRGPVSPPERKRSYSRSQSQSTDSPVVGRRSRVSDEGSSRSSSSFSHSTFSRSSSSSSSSSESSTSSSSRETSARKRTLLKPRSPPVPSRVKVKEQLKPSQDTHTAKPVVTKKAKRPMSSNITTSLKRRRTCSDSDSSSNGSSSDSEDEDVEDGEDGDVPDRNAFEGTMSTKEAKSGNAVPRLSLSERFGKLAQLSSQRRSLELVQLRIVAPVGGASTTEKNVSIDESSAAPVISAKPQREHSNEPSVTTAPNHHSHHHHHHPNPHPHPHPTTNPHLAEESVRKDERARDDRWRDWHERYDQYRHVQPPRQLPRDWDDIRVRHKYYTDRGYFGHDMTLEELSRWEAWWHRYQQWRRGYEHAWIKTHGPLVPVEYPDWTHYRSTNNRGEIAQIGSSMTSSIRSRLGWRR